MVIPTAFDEVLVFGGGKNKDAELRSWCPKIGDYSFKKIVVTGQELIESPNCYDSALPTFLDTVTEKEMFPNISSESRLIFGNEIDCFLVELTKDLQANFFKSPMKLQQKTGQNSVRSDANTIYLAGGTDTSRTKISSKTYRFTFSNNEVVELDKLTLGRYFPVMVNEGSLFFVIGGKVQGGAATNSVEWINFSSPGEQKWADTPPMKHARCGHVAWIGEGKLYVMGGTSQDKGKPIDEVEVYDIAAKTWSVHPSTFRLRSSQDDSCTDRCSVR